MCHKSQVGECKKFPNYIKVWPICHMYLLWFIKLNTIMGIWKFIPNKELFVELKSKLICMLIFIPWWEE
jgi:hypothetical protein